MEKGTCFISYRRTDVEFVKKLYDPLAKTYEIWVDWEDIPPGVTDFTAEIATGIDTADVFIAVLSPGYMTSEYCLGELARAVELRKRIVPLVYQKFEDAHPPASISHINWVYFVPHAGQENSFDEAMLRLRQAMTADYDYLRDHTRLLTRAQEWDKNQRNVSFLLRGVTLEEAEDWLTAGLQKDPRPTQLHSDYVAASRKNASRRQRTLLSGVGAALLVTLVLLVVAVLLANYANDQKAEAEIQRDIAVRSAAEAQSLAQSSAADLARRQGEYSLAVALALQSTSIDDPPADSQQTLREIAYSNGLRAELTGDLSSGQAVSADGNYSLQAADTGYDLYDAAGNVIQHFELFPAVPVGGDQPLVSADGSVSAEATQQGNEINIIFTDTKTGRTMGEAPAPPQGFLTSNLSPDGKWFAGGTDAANLIVYNIDSRRPSGTFAGHTLPINMVAFSSDDQVLVSFAQAVEGGSTQIIVWNVNTATQIGSFTSFRDQRRVIGFSMDGKQLLTQSYGMDGAQPLYHVWDTTDGSNLWEESVRNPSDAVFSADGTLVMVLSSDHALNIYRAADGTLVDSPESGSTYPVALGAFSADNLSYSYTQETRGGSQRIVQRQIADGSETTLSELGESVLQDAVLMLTCDSDCGTYSIQETVIGNTRAQFSESAAGEMGSAIFAVNDQFLVYQWGQEIVIRDTTSGEVVQRWPVTGLATATPLAMSPDASVVAYATQDNRIALLNVADGSSMQHFSGMPQGYARLTFSPDGTMLAIGGRGRGGFVLDINGQQQIMQITTVTDGINLLTFSPDSKRLLIGAGEDGTVTLWRVDTLADLRVWTSTNRAIAEFTCEQRLGYHIEPYCEQSSS